MAEKYCFVDCETFKKFKADLENQIQDVVDSLGEIEDSDNQQLSLNDNCELVLTNGGDPIPLPGTRNIYRLGDGVTGVRNREWHDTAPVVAISASSTAVGRAFRLGHDFSLPTTSDTIITNLNLNDTNNTAQELDVQVLDTVITVPTGGIWVRYTGGSEGYWAIEVGQCCGPLELRDELGYTDREDNTATVGPVFLPEGQHNFRAWNIDSGGTNSSHTVSYSTDGTSFSNALPAGTTLTQGKRPVECEQIGICQEVTEGWQLCPITTCVSTVVDPKPTDAVEVPKACDVIPIADNEADASIRTGSAGTSDEYARCDHNHPIKRQANPGDPILTFNGSSGSEMIQQLILDRISTEEWYAYKVRTRWSVEAGNGWNFMTVPTIAGFQQPMIYGIGTYRTTSNAPQDDNGTFGASPRGPFMASEAHEWSSTRRVYLAHFRRDNNYTKYVEFWVKYVRT